ncbi:LuxR C-terminal-related transcriptional regulator [Gorillibacterium sp. sgz5001074]|uniref:helix-turn-helix transcriptional regulator n=1 Tax=Gorillibacterium sp. sgz5001074 TaxID=3446695 RepID=UPI003F6730EF
MGVFASEVQSDTFHKAIGVNHEELVRFHEKSLLNGVQRDTMRIRFRIQGKMLERLLLKNQLLMNIVHKEGNLVFNSFYFPYMFMVTDANGVIMFMSGDEASLDNVERINNIGIGSSMSFSSAGTNAIAASIELQRPVCLCGPDHFLQTFHDWTSLCVPVRNTENHIAAYVALSSYYEVPALLVYPCIESIAFKLEQELKKAEMQSKNWFVEEMLEERLRTFPLTAREKEVAMYWLLDYDYKQIGKVVGISENTVRVYIARINGKMRVNSKASLILRVLGAI